MPSHLPLRFAVVTLVAAAMLAPACRLALAGPADLAEVAAVWRWESAAAALCAVAFGLVVAQHTRRRLSVRNADVEKALMESERRFRDLVEMLPEVVFETDARGRLVYLNRQARELTGYDGRDLAKGLAAIDMIAPDERERARANIAAVAAGRDLGHNEYTALRKDGTTFPVTVHSRAILRDGQMVGLRGTVLDITERKRVEDALRRAKQEAEVASRAKSEFLAAVSHELRTPLNAIIGFSDMMRRGTHGPIDHVRYRDYVHDIHESGEHLLELINDILDLAKIESGKDDLARRPVDVADNARASLTLVHQRARARGISLALDIEDGLPALDADPRKLKQVFVNLLTNAIKFTAEGGRVTLSARRAADGGLALTVADTGIGIAPEDIPKALSQFGQVKKDPDFAHEGTGLGLPLTKAIVEQHGGTLALESEPGIGTVVRLAFPPACLVEAPSAAPAPTASAAAG